MKTLFKSLICTLILILGASIQSEAFASIAEDYVTVNGIVKDSQTKKKSGVCNNFYSWNYNKYHL
jgi:hypothetical protein